MRRLRRQSTSYLFFCNPDVNLTGACGSDYSVLFPPEEEQGEGEQGESFSEGTGESFDVSEGQGTPDFEGGESGGEMLLDNVIEIFDDITTNTIWTADNRYRITGYEWDRNIAVYALLVIEPGTVIEFMPDTSLGPVLGGCLISAGTPDKPIIYTRAVSDQPYYNAISINRTSSAQTKITYSHFYGAEKAIYLDNIRLDHPIENNYFYNNGYGIKMNGEDKHTDIINNLFEQTTYTAIFAAIYSGIPPGGTCIQYFNSDIAIRNNTCDGQERGIYLLWPIDPDYAGRVEVANNIVSRSNSYGFIGFGYFNPLIACNGYYSNAVNSNWGELEYNPVYEANIPFVAGSDGSYYLRYDCNFVNNGYEYIEQTSLIGKTTNVAGLPDGGIVNIGYHYPNWNFSNAGDGNSLTMDLFADSFVDFKDFAILASGWQNDFNVYDLNTMTHEWLKTIGGPDIQVQISGDPNNGYVDFGAGGYSSDTRRVFLLADGKYVGEIFRFKNGYTLTTDISDSNGAIDLKLIGVDKFGRITCSDVNSAEFQRTLNYCVLPETYKKGSELPFAAYNSGAGDITVKVYAGGGNLVWSQTFSGNSILGSIPVEITANQNDIDYVSFDDGNGQSIAKKITDPNEPDSSVNVLALIVLPTWYFRLQDFQTIWTVQHAFKSRGIVYAKLSGKNAAYNKVSWYASNKNIKYLYLGCTHGYYKPDEDEPLRTTVYLYPNETVVSIKRSDYIDPNNAPSWCVELNSNEKDEYHSFAMMGFTRLEFAYFDICYSGRLKINANNELVVGQPGQQGVFDIPHSDMSFALGMVGSGRSNFYQGWYDKQWSEWFPQETEYQRWSQLEWTALGEGLNLYNALYYTIEQQTHFDVNDPVNCYRLKGMGYMDDIVLRNW